MKLFAARKEWNHIAVALAHLLSVSAGYYSHVFNDVFLRKREYVAVKGAVELLCSIACVLNMLLLILSYRHACSIVQQNVCRHEHWVIKGAYTYLFVLCFSILECVCTHEVRHRRERIENPGEFGVRRHVRLLEKHCLLGVDTDGEECSGEFARQATHLFPVLHAIECMVVGHHEVALMYAIVLHIDKLLECAEVVANMRLTCRFNTGEQNRLLSHGYTIAWVYSLHKW